MVQKREPSLTEVTGPPQVHGQRVAQPVLRVRGLLAPSFVPDAPPSFWL